MKQSYEVEMDDGSTYEIDADARDVRRWEAKYEKSYLSSPVSFTEIAQVAYLAGQRTGVLNGQYPSYEDFDAHCVEARGRVKVPTVGSPTPPEATHAISAS